MNNCEFFEYFCINVNHHDVSSRDVVSLGQFVNVNVFYEIETHFS